MNLKKTCHPNNNLNNEFKSRFISKINKYSVRYGSGIAGQ